MHDSRHARAPAVALALLTVLAGCACGSGTPRRPSPTEREATERAIREVVAAQTTEALTRFDSEEDLRSYLQALARLQRRASRGAVADEAVAEAQAAPTASTDTDGESITNNQVAGVDEGGIVKAHGDHLIVLRRGRLFSARLGDEDLTPVSMVDAYPSDAAGGWYDEMLVHDDTIVVIGFDYRAGGTEIGLFDIDDAGTIARRGTHYLRSNDS